jgi:hypothetical protein
VLQLDDASGFGAEHDQEMAMMISDIAALLTGEPHVDEIHRRPEPASHDEIARLSYHFYEARGRRDGQDLDHWLAAERELTRHYR